MKRRNLMHRRWVIAVFGLAAAAAIWKPLALLARQEPEIKVTGCVERDAAASAPTFKLVVTAPESRARIYRLDAPKGIDLQAALGKTAAVTGVAMKERAAGREVDVIRVKSLEIVSDGCRE
jgi:hypothetical protein